MAFAERAEPDAGGYGDQSLLHQELGKLQRPAIPIWLGDGRPEEHRSLGRLDGPAGALEPGDQRVTALAVSFADLTSVFGAFAQRDDCGDLQGLEHPVVEIALDARQGGDHLAVPQTISDAPSGHIEALG